MMRYRIKCFAEVKIIIYSDRENENEDDKWQAEESTVESNIAYIDLNKVNFYNKYPKVTYYL